MGGEGGGVESGMRWGASAGLGKEGGPRRGRHGGRLNA